MTGKRPRFWIGVALMAASFGVYPGYVLIAFLLLTTEGKIELGLGDQLEPLRLGQHARRG